MDHLPLEILHSIFIKLGLKDRLDCMLICRAWNDALDRHSLLYDLDISYSQYIKVKDMLERLPYRANQVEILTFRTENSTDFDKRRLCNILPNLREIELQETSDDSTRNTFMNTRFQFTNQTSKVERIIDYGDCEVTRQLALSNLCSRLKSLTLTFDIPSSNSKHVIPQLINMPVLEYLELTNIKVELMELELLHQNVPSIQSIFFNYAFLYTCEVPRDVKPAASVTKLGLNIDSAQNRQAHIEFYLYLGKKYPLVDTFTRNFDFTIAEDDSDYARDVYNGGVFPFYQIIGPRIDTFEFVKYCDGLDAFRKFDDSGIKLKELTITSSNTEIPFLGELAQSQQAKYLEKLMVNDMGIEGLEKINRMEALESLTIDCHMTDANSDGYTIDFSQLIEACPARLSTVVTHYAPIIFTEPTSNLTSITLLELNHLELTPTLAKCLETSFPKLLTLYLQGTVSTPVTISLSSHHLEEVDISIKGRKSSDLSTVTSCIDGIQHYALKKSTRRNKETLLFKYDGKTSQPDETPSEEDSTILTFMCASVKELCFFAGN